jgi:toxin YhaV
MARSRSSRRGAAGGLPAGGGDRMEVNGWTLLLHPLLVAQLEKLTAAAEMETRRARGGGTPATANTKVVAALFELMFRAIPEDPTRADYRQGATLGERRKHWFRAKFGAGRFRLFFRYLERARVIVYVWVNDEESLRTYGGRTDAYAVFRRMLDSGNPPESFDELVQAATATENARRVRRVAKSRGSDESSPRST